MFNIYKQKRDEGVIWRWNSRLSDRTEAESEAEWLADTEREHRFCVCDAETKEMLALCDKGGAK